MDIKDSITSRNLRALALLMDIPVKDMRITINGNEMIAAAGYRDDSRGGKMFFRIIFPDGDNQILTQQSDQSISLLGTSYSQSSCMIQALRFIVDTLEEQSGDPFPEI